MARQLEQDVREFSHQVKMMFKEHEEKLITNQMIQARLADCALWLYANSCVLSRADRTIGKGVNGKELEQEMNIARHAVALGHEIITDRLRQLRNNTDDTMRACAQSTLEWIDTLPNEEFIIPESTKDESALGKGREPDQTHINQFGEGTIFNSASSSA